MYVHSPGYPLVRQFFLHVCIFWLLLPLLLLTVMLNCCFVLRRRCNLFTFFGFRFSYPKFILFLWIKFLLTKDPSVRGEGDRVRSHVLCVPGSGGGARKCSEFFPLAILWLVKYLKSLYFQFYFLLIFFLECLVLKSSSRIISCFLVYALIRIFSSKSVSCLAFVRVPKDFPSQNCP